MRTAFCVQYGQRPDWIDELRTTDRDVFELCWSNDPPDDAIHLSNSTWTQGRNALAQAVRRAEAESGFRYEYLVMADDDISFENASHAQGMTRFEATIEKYRPAVAAPIFGWHYENLKHLDRSAEVQGIYATDMLLQALHRDVWWVLLPFWEEFDSQSWWNSGHILNRIAGTTYAGAVVSVNTVTVLNARSSDYPRDGRCVAADQMLSEMAKPKTLWHRHETKESFLPQELRLNQTFRRTRVDLARLWDMNHRFWKSRVEDGVIGMRAAA